jgi:hypothetical protein
MTARLFRFPDRRIEAVLVIPEPLGGHYVIVHEFGWLFGSRRDAEREARALARQHGLPVREVEA